MKQRKHAAQEAEHIADTLGVRPLVERRQKVKLMYDMLHSVAVHTGPRGMIVGDGFFIAHAADGEGNDQFTVFRRGFGSTIVSHIGRVAGLFTPDMFFDGINPRSAECPALPESSRCR